MWGQFIWFRGLGYIRERDIIRSGAVVYVVLTAVITVLTSDLITVVFLGIIALLAFRFASIERYISPRRRVLIYSENGLYVAEHVDTGTTRHGTTALDALANLRSVVGHPPARPAPE